MTDLKKGKSDIREEYRKKRRDPDPEVKQKLDEQLCEKIINSQTYKSAEVVLTYIPKTEEVNIIKVAETALKDGKKLACPKCDTKSRTMVFKYIDSFDQLEDSVFGLREPVSGCEVFVQDNVIDNKVICVVPAIVFDKKGFRIGYGGGYYDRYLSTFHGIKVGVSYYDFIVNEAPHGKFDFAVDVLITERGIYAKK
jgi:5-formyltetrahydrofolate cyclo-ligase